MQLGNKVGHFSVKQDDENAQQTGGHGVPPYNKYSRGFVGAALRGRPS